MHHSEVDDNKTLLKVVNEIVLVYETREQIEFNDQTPLLEINPRKMAAILTNGVPAAISSILLPLPLPPCSIELRRRGGRGRPICYPQRYLAVARLHICSIVIRSER
jgi:hypothetical protein